MQNASGPAILSHPWRDAFVETLLRNPERQRGAVVRNPEAGRGAASAGTERFVYRHGLALFVNNILDRCPNCVSRPEVAGAAVSRPAATIGTVDPSLVQATAAIRLHRVQYLVWFAVCHHDNVDVICTNVGGQQRPATTSAHLPQAFQYEVPAYRIEQIAILCHSASGLLLLRSIRFRKRSAESISSA